MCKEETHPCCDSHGCCACHDCCDCCEFEREHVCAPCPLSHYYPGVTVPSIWIYPTTTATSTTTWGEANVP